MSLALARCAAAPPPFPLPAIGSVTDAELVEILRSRTEGAGALYAELVMGYDGAGRDGTFDAVALFRSGGWMRLTAFKDLILGTEPIFDVVLTPSDYALEIVDRESDVATRERGTAREFPSRRPDFAAFFWAREALCSPGRVAAGAEARVSRAGPGLARVESRLSTGAAVSWIVDRETAAVESALVRAPADGGDFRLRYAEYRLVGGYLVPGRVVLEDPARETVVDVLVHDTEMNPDFDERAFDLASVGGL